MLNSFHFFAKSSHIRILSLLILISSLQAFFSDHLQAAQAQFAIGPESNQSLLLKTLTDAKHEIIINMYEFTHPKIADTLIDRMKQGISVKILLEDQPFPRISDDQEKIIEQLKQAINEYPKSESCLFLMKATSSRLRRYRYDHAKYMVIDQHIAYVTSENFSPTGHADPGVIGNRGWDIALDDIDAAASLLALFTTDADPKQPDIIAFRADPALKATATPDSPKNLSVTPTPAQGIQLGTVKSTQLIAAPNALAGIQTAVRTAKKHLEIQMLSLPSQWRTSDTSGIASYQLNPIVSELILAARRGVQVRVLLNDDRVFDANSNSSDGTPKPNTLTAQLLLRYAQCHHLPLQARIIDVQKAGITYVHNKGILTDGTRAWISSINGTKNSVMNNRETAFWINSTDAARFYGNAFNSDWLSSENTLNTISPVEKNTTPQNCPPLPASG